MNKNKAKRLPRIVRLFAKLCNTKSIKKEIELFKALGKHLYKRALLSRLRTGGATNNIRHVKRKRRCRDVLLVMHTLERLGAPVVLTDMARILIENSVRPIVVSSCDGPLRQDYLEMGIPVVIDKSFENDSVLFELYARNFDLVVVNTFQCSKAITALNDSSLPVLWWIHEPLFILNQHKYLTPDKISDNIKVFAVSNYCLQSLHQFGINNTHGVLPYGISDCAANYDKQAKQNKFTFLNVGNPHFLKGHDVLLNAIALLDDKYKEKAQFIFVGNSNIPKTEVDELLYKAANENRCIIWLDAMPRGELFNYFQIADCIIVASRQESLSVVANESMMFSTPVICSSETGNADYLTNKENGLIFLSEDSEALAQQIMFAIDNSVEMEKMGQKARTDIFEKHFTLDIFANNIQNTIRDIIDTNVKTGQ